MCHLYIFIIYFTPVDVNSGLTVLVEKERKKHKPVRLCSVCMIFTVIKWWNCEWPLFDVFVYLYVELTPRYKHSVSRLFRWDSGSAPGLWGRCLLLGGLELNSILKILLCSFLNVQKKTPTKELGENSKVTTAWKLNSSIMFIRHILFHCCNHVLLGIQRSLCDNNSELRGVTCNLSFPSCFS